MKAILISITILFATICHAHLDHKQHFFNMHDMEARAIEKMYAVPYHTMMAIAALESGWGTSKIYKEKCNPFGLRNSDGTYKKFNSYADAFVFFGKLLSSSERYNELHCCDNWRMYIIKLAELGYNTERPEWPGEVIRIILSNKRLKNQVS